MKSCGSCCKVCKILVLVGALNWGLVGAFNFNLVEAVLGSVPMAERAVYIIIGLSAVMAVIGMLKGGCCTSGGSGGSCCAAPSAPSGGDDSQAGV